MSSKQEMMLLALAVKQGLIRKDQVQECMDLQAAIQEQKGIEMSLLEVAQRKKYLTAEQVANLSGGAVSVPGVGDSVTVDEAARIPIFDVDRVIGQGGMAQVFLARHKQSGQQVALKVLYPRHVGNKKFVERFIREGRLLKQFESQNIAKGFDYGVVGRDSANPLYFMSMEFIDGPSIQDLLDRDGPFDEQKSIYVITEAAKALAYMQERGVVHRDVKPDNIMWAGDGRVLLVDLGFATSIRKDLAGHYEDETCGTVQYISPEQAKGMADLDIRADIYSLGATLYHMVVGELPFTGKDSLEVMSKQVIEALDTRHMKGGKISVHMHYFIEKMMSKDRDFRYQTAREAVDDIEEVLQGAADMKYDPAKDPNNPFTLGGVSQRFKAGHSTGKFAPIGSKSTSSLRHQSSGSTTSIRQRGATRPTGTLRMPTAPDGSVRMPAPPNQPTGKSVRMPAPRKNGDNGKS